MSFAETVAKNYKYSGHLSTDHAVENVLKVHKLWMKTKYHFGDCWQVRPLIWNIPANYKGGLEHVVDFFKFVLWVLTESFWLPGTFLYDPPSLLACPMCFLHVSESIVSRMPVKFRNNYYHTCDFQKSLHKLRREQQWPVTQTSKYSISLLTELWKMWVCPSNRYKKFGVVRSKEDNYWCDLNFQNFVSLWKLSHRKAQKR
jgi:hypothetical protein